jgi:molybdopterin-guanine dinucleotide biosynthesis protein A
MSRRQIAGVLLTGGASTRMGVDKARLVVNGETLAARSARVLASVCDPVIEVGTGVSGLPAVQEDPAGAGPLVALLAGVGALGEPHVVVLLACDLPNVSAPLLQLLVDRPGSQSVIPVVGSRAQYACARYGATAFAAARTALLEGSTGLRELARADCEYLAESDWGPFAMADEFADVDTPDDLRRLGLPGAS